MAPDTRNRTGELACMYHKVRRVSLLPVGGGGLEGVLRVLPHPCQTPKIPPSSLHHTPWTHKRAQRCLDPGSLCALPSASREPSHVCLPSASREPTHVCLRVHTLLWAGDKR